MSTNDYIKHLSGEITKDRASVDAPVASVLPDDHAAGAEKTGADKASAVLHPSDHSMPNEFTFFQKRKRATQAVLAPSEFLPAPRSY